MIRAFIFTVFLFVVMGKSGVTTETGSARLHRSHLFNKYEEDMDVPDGDIGYGRQIYKELCAG